MPTVKTCRECKQNLDESAFRLYDKTWRSSICNPCRSRQRYENKLKHVYKINMEHKRRLVEQQQGMCAICSQPTPTLCVDHDHSTGVVRGLLCHNCNKGLGLFGDNVRYLTKAIEYLKSVDTPSKSPIITNESDPIHAVRLACPVHI